MTVETLCVSSAWNSAVIDAPLQASIALLHVSDVLCAGIPLERSRSSAPDVKKIRIRRRGPCSGGHRHAATASIALLEVSGRPCARYSSDDSSSGRSSSGNSSANPSNCTALLVVR
jgi:hypothetical protein